MTNPAMGNPRAQLHLDRTPSVDFQNERLNEMSMAHFPVGQRMNVTYPAFMVSVTLESATRLTFHIAEGPFARTETVDVEVIPLGHAMFALSWREKDGANVVNIHDYDRGIVRSFATLPDGRFLRMEGPIEVTTATDRPAGDSLARNKALVVEAMTALFQRRDAAAVERLYSPDYKQHNPNIPQGRDALQSIVGELSSDVFYEPGMVIAEDSFVAIHGRIRGWAATPQIVVDLFRIENGQLAEHWDVLQDEVADTAAVGGTPMFAPDERSRQDAFGS